MLQQGACALMQNSQVSQMQIYFSVRRRFQDLSDTLLFLTPRMVLALLLSLLLFFQRKKIVRDLKEIASIRTG